MYNTPLPTRAELPTSRQLLRSTAIAVGVAAALLVTVVLPAEHAIDPTGIGRALGLTKMGEIKGQLHREAQADRAGAPTPAAPPAPGAPPVPERRSGLALPSLAGLLVGEARAQAAPAPAATAAPARSETITLTLAPGEGKEVKAVMRAGAKATYRWSAGGGAVNYDMHGTEARSGKETSYKRGRSAAADEGVLAAGFDGQHGWFWRNRGAAPAVVTLSLGGDFTDLALAK